MEPMNRNETNKNNTLPGASRHQQLPSSSYCLPHPSSNHSHRSLLIGRIANGLLLSPFVVRI
uniref:Uncharacterized protein n=1 Tax=Cucumis melo TaxID=3656 RepID=A0A9I9E843_CUCME